MARFIVVQLYGAADGSVPPPPPVKIRADTIEKAEAGKTVLKLNNEIVGEFNSAIQGWWIQDD